MARTRTRGSPRGEYRMSNKVRIKILARPLLVEDRHIFRVEPLSELFIPRFAKYDVLEFIQRRTVESNILVCPHRTCKGILHELREHVRIAVVVHGHNIGFISS